MAADAVLPSPSIPHPTYWGLVNLWGSLLILEFLLWQGWKRIRELGDSGDCKDREAVLACVGPPHGSEGCVAMSTIEVCKRNKPCVSEQTQILNLERLKCHSFCHKTNFTQFPLRKEADPSLPGDVYRLHFIFFLYDIITPELWKWLKTEEMTWKRQVMVNTILN